MKRRIYFFLIVFVAGFYFSCDTNIADLNENIKDPNVAPADALFSNAQKGLFDLMVSINVNRNVFRLYAQYNSQTTYPDESQYQMVVRNIPDNFWNIMYRDVLKDLDEARTLTLNVVPVTPDEEALQTNQLACITLYESYAYGVLLDLFGDIPYSEALDINNVLPKYDDAQSVHNTLIANASAAVESIDDAFGSFGSSDLAYHGDMSQWKKFGASLILRAAIRMADADDAGAKELAEKFAGDVMASNADNMSLTYLGSTPNTNPLWVDLVASGRADFVAANTIVDMMNTLEDNRRGSYFDEDPDGLFSGGIYGTNNEYSVFSHLGSVLHQPETPGTILNYSEVCFLLAEAVERGYAVGGTASDWYHAGIEASFDEWGASGASDYILNPDVDYSSAAGDWKMKIGTQKWIALYNRGFEGWTEWRRLDAPAFNAPDGMTVDDIPTRMIYPVNESTLNGTSYDAAAAKYGADSPTAKLFWDIF